MPENSLHIIKTAEELAFLAEDYATKINDNTLKESQKLYFIARYLVAVYETHVGELPIQVWNEYRNALDHFFRSNIAVDASDTTFQLGKMEAHLQRAALDASKYLYHDLITIVNKNIDSDGPNCLRLVSDGNFYRDIKKNIALASEKFQKAKVQDQHLSADTNENDKILMLYLESVFLLLDIDHLLTTTKRPEIERAISKSKIITWKKDVKNAAIGLAVGIIATLIFNSNPSGSINSDKANSIDKVAQE